MAKSRINTKTFGLFNFKLTIESVYRENFTHFTFELMEIPELPYTVPRVVMGRTITRVPIASTSEKEVAKQSGYAEFFFRNAAEERMKRKVTRKLKPD